MPARTVQVPTVRVSPEELPALAAALRRALEVTGAGLGDSTSSPAGSGSTVVDDAVSELLSAWTRGMRMLREQGDALADQLDEAATRYLEVDCRVALWSGRPET